LRNKIADNALNFFSTTWDNKYYIPDIATMIDTLWSQYRYTTAMK
jgi:hypothetical protein